MDPMPLDAELDVFLARARMTVPPERFAAIRSGYADFRAQMDLLHERWDAAEEPSNIFRAKGTAR